MKCWRSGGGDPGEGGAGRAHQQLLLPPCMACGTCVSGLGCSPGQQGQAVAPVSEGLYCLLEVELNLADRGNLTCHAGLNHTCYTAGS